MPSSAHFLTGHVKHHKVSKKKKNFLSREAIEIYKAMANALENERRFLGTWGMKKALMGLWRKDLVVTIIRI